ncbi:MAG: carbon-nitrogen hydrolase family protein [Myxococcota bacterium]
MTDASPVRVAAIQLNATLEIQANVAKVRELCAEARAAGAHWACLPENSLFMGPEGEAVAHAAPVEESRLLEPLRGIARTEELVLFVGSVPEVSPEDGRAYNCSVVLGRAGEILATYRKVHLFDVELPDGTAVRESDGWLAGTEPACVEVDGWKVGLSICYDLRFPEHYRMLVDLGADVIMVPSAFTLQTGKDHWEPLLRSRAIENQCYVIAAAQWGEHFPGRTTWGKSMVIDPWGTVLATAPERASSVIATLDPAAQERVRARFPSLQHRQLR